MVMEEINKKWNTFKLFFIHSFHIYEEMPQLSWFISSESKTNWAALPHELFQDWSLIYVLPIWSIYIRVWLNRPRAYVHSSSHCKQKIICWSFEIRSNWKSLTNLWFCDSFYSPQGLCSCSFKPCDRGGPSYKHFPTHMLVTPTAAMSGLKRTTATEKIKKKEVL